LIDFVQVYLPIHFFVRSTMDGTFCLQYYLVNSTKFAFNEITMDYGRLTFLAIAHQLTRNNLRGNT
jgi:hypothetical protein